VTGLDYDNARWYDPVSGQFLSPDSVQGNAQGMDPYAYVGNDPETRVDPTGQMYAGGGGQGKPNQNDCNANHSLSGCPQPPSLPQCSRGFLLQGSSCVKDNYKPHISPIQAVVLPAGSLATLQQLVRQNTRLAADFESDNWTVLSAKSGGATINDSNGFPQRWYVTFDDGNGSKVTMSVNFNPSAGPNQDAWDMQRIKFSSIQPDPGKWGVNGSARSVDGVDPGASENPGDEADQSFFSKMFGALAGDDGGPSLEDATVTEDFTD
jgi:uncharacterized protein RhaS with RHS repeats